MDVPILAIASFISFGVEREGWTTTEGADDVSGLALVVFDSGGLGYLTVTRTMVEDEDFNVDAGRAPALEMACDFSAGAIFDMGAISLAAKRAVVAHSHEFSSMH